MNQENWKALVNSMPLPALVLDASQAEPMAVQANSAALGLLGLKDGWSPRSVQDFMPPLEYDQFTDRLIAGKEILQVESAWVGAYRQPFQCRARLRRLVAGGDVWLALLEDVTAQRQAMTALRENERSYRRIVEHSPDAIAVLGEGMVIFANEACEQLLGLGPEDLWGAEFADFVSESDLDGWNERSRSLEQGDVATPTVEMRLKRSDGSWVEVELTQYAAFGGDRGGMQVVMRDIGPRKTMEREVRESEERYKGLADAAFDGVAVHVDGLMVDVNRSFEEIFSREPGSLLGQRIDMLFRKEHRKYFNKEKDSGSVVELEAEGPGTSVITLEASSRACRYKNGDGFVTAIRDITLRKEAEEAIRHQAYYDGLTGLPNRILFHDVLHARLTEGDVQRRGALMFLDLDRFKPVNDTLGHDVGDRLLQQTAQRLESLVRKGDTVCRLGGDEFTVLLPEIENESEAVIIAEKIVEQLNRPFEIGEVTVQVGTSLGLAFMPEHGSDEETIMKNADAAMYAVKAAGRNHYRVWEKGMELAGRERPGEEAALRKAMARGEFRLHYQPKIDLKDGSVVGAEALIRWQRNGELLDAGEFVPFAEEIGLTLPMGEWVLDEACRQGARWRDMGLSHLTVSINLSAWQLQRQALMDMIESALMIHKFEASLLEVEITESAAMKNPGFAVSVLTELKKMGIAISLDDFGTGYSSLENLKRFPIEVIKIDRAFIKGCHLGGKDAAIVKAVIMLARSLHLKVLAEGVEEQAEADFLKIEGCDMAQGFLYSRPIPADDFERFYRNNQLRLKGA